MSNRKHAVRDECGSLSDWIDVLREVPQRSGLGPTLFYVIILIIDIITALHHMKQIIYADDLQAYLSCRLRDLPEALYLVENDFLSVFDWLIANKLKLNIQKTKITITESCKLISQIDYNTLYQINLDNRMIPFVTTVQNLVIRSEDLIW